MLIDLPVISILEKQSLINFCGRSLVASTTMFGRSKYISIKGNVGRYKYLSIKGNGGRSKLMRIKGNVGRSKYISIKGNVGRSK